MIDKRVDLIRCVSRINGIPLGELREEGFTRAYTSPSSFRLDPVPIEDQFGRQTSACHLGVFTGARIIHPNPFRNAYKSRDRGRSAAEKVGQGGFDPVAG